MEQTYKRVNIYKNRDFLESEPAIKLLGFEQFDCQGIQEYELTEGEVDQILGDRSYSSAAEIPDEIYSQVSAYADDSQKVVSYFFHQDQANSFMNYLSQNYPDLSISMETIPKQDWNETWKQHYQNIEISNDLKIVPIWDKYKSNQANSVFIDPGQGFGTGNHETTYLCLKLLNDYAPQIQTCFDYGCGSGILGIAAAKLHALSKLYFYDIDESALDNCIINLENNEPIAARDIWVNAQIHGDSQYDLVFANILEHVLISESDSITDLVKSKGCLILSGILKEQAKSVANSYIAKGFQLSQRLDDGDWSALLFHKL